MDGQATIVFGGTGFIGGNVYGWLASKGGTVHSLGSRDCDLTNRDAVAKVLDQYGPDARIVLCSSIGRTTEDSHAAFLKNVAMAHNVAVEAAAHKAASLVYLSSTDVFGTPPAELPVTETTLPRPDTYYGASKLAAESMIFLGSGDALPAACLRLPGIFGPGETNTSIIRLFLNKAKKGETITLSGGGTIKRDYVFVKDLCAIIERFLAVPVSGVFNIATGSPASLRELAETAFAAVGREPALELAASSDSRSHDLVFDPARLMGALGEFSFTSMTEAMAACLADA